MSKSCLFWCQVVSALSFETLSSARTRPSPPMPSRSASRNFWRLSLSALASASSSGPRALASAILPSPVAASRADLDDRVLHELDERVGELGRRVAREDVGDELAHRLALVAAPSPASLSSETSLAISSGLNAGAAAEALHLGEVALAVELHRLVEDARVVQRDERPGDLRAIGVVGLEQRLLQRVFARVGVGRAEVGEHLRGDAADAVVDLGERVDRERDRRLVAFPAELDQRFLLELVLVGLRGELAPLGDAVGLGQDVDVLLDGRDLDRASASPTRSSARRSRGSRRR